MTADEQREKIWLLVLSYASKFGHEEENKKWHLATSEMVYQNDDMQIEGLELICSLLDALNG